MASFDPSDVGLNCAELVSRAGMTTTDARRVTDVSSAT